jgi:hypothetical protein
MGGESFDVFLSYHTPDRAQVIAVRHLLTARGILSFIDRDNLIAGQPWPSQLEAAIANARAVIVFIGRHGLGVWQKRESYLSLGRQANADRLNQKFPVIPVLLPGSDPTPGFLFLNHGIDLRSDPLDPDAIEALALAVRGSEYTGAPIAEGLCPFKGLHAFGEDSAAFFCGRKTQSQELLDTVLMHNLVTVVGPSGTGKSSLVHAGLLPLLRGQRPPQSTWNAFTFKPRADPFLELADTLSRELDSDLSEMQRQSEFPAYAEKLRQGRATLKMAVKTILEKDKGTDRLLLIVDQFEELFTATKDIDRKPFINMLLDAKRQASLTVLFILRADFFGHAIGLSSELHESMKPGLFTLGQMKREELEQAITQPAKRVGLRLEQGLDQRLLDDVRGEPGNLPLLEFALTELYQRRKDNELTHHAYQEIGGLEGAIATRADEVYLKLTPIQRATARRMMLRLTNLGEGTGDTRRRAALTEFVADGEQVTDVEEVVDKFVSARLLVSSDVIELDLTRKEL